MSATPICGYCRAEVPGNAEAMRAHVAQRHGPNDDPEADIARVAKGRDAGHALPYDPAMLEELDRAVFRGQRPRPAKSPARDRLQSLGLIESARPSGMRNDCRAYWRPTAKGRDEAEKNRKEGIT